MIREFILLFTFSTSLVIFNATNNNDLCNFELCFNCGVTHIINKDQHRIRTKDAPMANELFKQIISLIAAIEFNWL